MQVSARSYLTAGVAFVGASAIALTPVAPPAPTVELRAAVTRTANLMANPTPLQLWAQVLTTSADNAAAITQSVLANPAPILKQVIDNQLVNASLLVEGLQGTVNTALPAIADLPETIRTALVQLANGNVKGAAETLLAPVFTVGFAALLPVAAIAEAVKTTTQNVANAIAVLVDPLNILGALVSVAGPILSAVNAVVDSAQAAVDGVMAGDIGAVATALINVPANLVGAVLNGHGTVLGFIPAPGLLTPSDPDAGLAFAGPLAYIQSLREQIGKAIAPPEPELQMLSETVDESDVPETPATEENGTVDDTADTSVDTSVVENVVESAPTEETDVVDKTVNTVTTAKTTPAVDTAATESVTTETENTTSSVETNSGAGTAVNTGPSEQEKRAAAAEERKAKREAARAERQAEREAQREAFKAEREAKRAERQAKQEANDASPTTDSDSGQSDKNDQAA